MGYITIDCDSFDEFLARLDTILSTLTPAEEFVVRASFGIGMEQIKTYREIGALLPLHGSRGSSRERARQIEKKALRKMRHPLRAQYLVEGRPDF